MTESDTRNEIEQAFDDWWAKTGPGFVTVSTYIARDSFEAGAKFGADQLAQKIEKQLGRMEHGSN